MLFSHLKVTIHAQGQAPRSRTLRLFTRGKLLHCQRLRPIDGLKKPETLGSSDSLTAPNPCAGGRRKTDGSQKPIHNVKERTHEIYPAG